LFSNEAQTVSKLLQQVAPLVEHCNCTVRVSTSVTTGLGFVVAEIEGFTDGEKGTIEKAGKFEGEEGATSIMDEGEGVVDLTAEIDAVVVGSLVAIISEGEGLVEAEIVVEGFFLNGVTVTGV